MTLANRDRLRRIAFAGLFFCGQIIAQAQSFHAVDLQGKPVERLDSSGSKVVVLIFAATDCPISKRYIPEIARLQKEFGAEHVAFWWVFSNPEDTVAVVRKHELDYSIHAATIIDAKQDLVKLAHVSVTPEAAVFAVEKGQLREAYHGRIDDLYFAFGQERPAAAHHDLEDAIREVLAGRPAAPAPHGPVGCSIIPLAMVEPAKR
jgi:thiol-disulfide isomerase/thioredoxin